MATPPGAVTVRDIAVGHTNSAGRPRRVRAESRMAELIMEESVLDLIVESELEPPPRVSKANTSRGFRAGLSAKQTRKVEERRMLSESIPAQAPAESQTKQFQVPCGGQGTPNGEPCATPSSSSAAAADTQEAAVAAIHESPPTIDDNLEPFTPELVEDDDIRFADALSGERQPEEENHCDSGGGDSDDCNNNFHTGVADFRIVESCAQPKDCVDAGILQQKDCVDAGIPPKQDLSLPSTIGPITSNACVPDSCVTQSAGCMSTTGMSMQSAGIARYDETQHYQQGTDPQWLSSPQQPTSLSGVVSQEVPFISDEPAVCHEPVCHEAVFCQETRPSLESPSLFMAQGSFSGKRDTSPSPEMLCETDLAQKHMIGESLMSVYNSILQQNALHQRMGHAVQCDKNQQWMMMSNATTQSMMQRQTTTKAQKSSDVKGVYKNCRGIWAAQWTDETGQRHTKYFNPKFYPSESEARHEACKFKVRIAQEVELRGGVAKRRPPMNPKGSRASNGSSVNRSRRVRGSTPGPRSRRGAALSFAFSAEGAPISANDLGLRAAHSQYLQQYQQSGATDDGLTQPNPFFADMYGSGPRVDHSYHQMYDASRQMYIPSTQQQIAYSNGMLAAEQQLPYHHSSTHDQFSSHDQPEHSVVADPDNSVLCQAAPHSAPVPSDAAIAAWTLADAHDSKHLAAARDPNWQLRPWLAFGGNGAQVGSVCACGCGAPSASPWTLAAHHLQQQDGFTPSSSPEALHHHHFPLAPESQPCWHVPPAEAASLGNDCYEYEGKQQQSRSSSGDSYDDSSNAWTSFNSQQQQQAPELSSSFKTVDESQQHPCIIGDNENQASVCHPLPNSLPEFENFTLEGALFKNGGDQSEPPAASSELANTTTTTLVPNYYDHTPPPLQIPTDGEAVHTTVGHSPADGNIANSSDSGPILPSKRRQVSEGARCDAIESVVVKEMFPERDMILCDDQNRRLEAGESQVSVDRRKRQRPKWGDTENNHDYRPNDDPVCCERLYYEFDDMRNNTDCAAAAAAGLPADSHKTNVAAVASNSRSCLDEAPNSRSCLDESVGELSSPAHWTFNPSWFQCCVSESYPHYPVIGKAGGRTEDGTTIGESSADAANESTVDTGSTCGGTADFARSESNELCQDERKIAGCGGDGEEGLISTSSTTTADLGVSISLSPTESGQSCGGGADGFYKDSAGGASSVASDDTPHAVLL